MDYLFNAIKNLSNKEIQLLRKRIGKQAQKVRLFNLVYDSDEFDLKEVMDKMGYTEKPTGFYTLKNRLYEDVIEVRIEIEKNEVTLTKEKVQNLRGLVYSRDSVTLLRELRKLEKKSFELELYAELKEIYFCYMMIYRHDRKKLMEYKSLMKDADFKQQTMMKLEELFYTKLLDTQDLFYYSNAYYYNEAEDALKQVDQINELLQCKSSKFLYLSAKLTLRLNDKIIADGAESKAIFKELVLMHKLYHNSFLIHRYPNCDIAIQCLFSKYYYSIGMEDQFENTQKYIMEKINTVTGFKMFECTIFYFIYVSVLSKVDAYARHKLAGLIAPFMTENNIDYFSNSMKNYFYYLLAVEAFYVGNFDKSTAMLLRSRKYFNFLDTNNCWVAVENILLNIYNYTQTREVNLIASELGLLSRVIAKFNLEDNYLKHVKELIKATKVCLNKKDFSAYHKKVNIIKLSSDEQLFKLVSFA